MRPEIRPIDYLPSALLAVLVGYLVYRFFIYYLDERYLGGLDRDKWALGFAPLAAIVAFILTMPLPR